MYQVFDHGKPADCHYHQNAHSLWDKSFFGDLEEALQYAHNWLGAWSPGIETLRNEAVGNVYNYNGYGDMIEIRQVAIPYLNR